MSSEQSLILDSYDILVVDEEERTYLRFDADMSGLRRPTSIVIDVPGAPLTLEDEQGVIVEFRKPVSEEEFVALSFSGAIHLMPMHPDTGEAGEIFPVPIQSRIHVVSDATRH